MPHDDWPLADQDLYTQARLNQVKSLSMRQNQILVDSVCERACRSIHPHYPATQQECRQTFQRENAKDKLHYQADQYKEWSQLAATMAATLQRREARRFDQELHSKTLSVGLLQNWIDSIPHASQQAEVLRTFGKQRHEESAKSKFQLRFDELRARAQQRPPCDPTREEAMRVLLLDLIRQVPHACNKAQTKSTASNQSSLPDPSSEPGSEGSEGSEGSDPSKANITRQSNQESDALNPRAEKSSHGIVARLMARMAAQFDCIAYPPHTDLPPNALHKHDRSHRTLLQLLQKGKQRHNTRHQNKQTHTQKRLCGFDLAHQTDRASMQVHLGSHATSKLELEYKADLDRIKRQGGFAPLAEQQRLALVKIALQDELSSEALEPFHVLAGESCAHFAHSSAVCVFQSADGKVFAWIKNPPVSGQEISSLEKLTSEAAPGSPPAPIPATSASTKSRKSKDNSTAAAAAAAASSTPRSKDGSNKPSSSQSSQRPKSPAGAKATHQAAPPVIAPTSSAVVAGVAGDVPLVSVHDLPLSSACWPDAHLQPLPAQDSSPDSTPVRTRAQIHPRVILISELSGLHIRTLCCGSQVAMIVTDLGALIEWNWENRSVRTLIEAEWCKPEDDKEMNQSPLDSEHTAQVQLNANAVNSASESLSIVSQSDGSDSGPPIKKRSSKRSEAKAHSANGDAAAESVQDGTSTPASARPSSSKAKKAKGTPGTASQIESAADPLAAPGARPPSQGDKSLCKSAHKSRPSSREAIASGKQTGKAATSRDTASPIIVPDASTTNSNQQSVSDRLKLDASIQGKRCARVWCAGTGMATGKNASTPAAAAAAAAAAPTSKSNAAPGGSQASSTSAAQQSASPFGPGVEVDLVFVETEDGCIYSGIACVDPPEALSTSSQGAASTKEAKSASGGGALKSNLSPLPVLLQSILGWTPYSPGDASGAGAQQHKKSDKKATSLSAPETFFANAATSQLTCGNLQLVQYLHPAVLSLHSGGGASETNSNAATQPAAKSSDATSLSDHRSPISIGPILTDASRVQVVGLACGVSHTFAVCSNGFVYSWGTNEFGQLGLNDRTERSHPTLVPCSTRIQAPPEIQPKAESTIAPAPASDASSAVPGAAPDAQSSAKELKSKKKVKSNPSDAAGSGGAAPGAASAGANSALASTGPQGQSVSGAHSDRASGPCSALDSLCVSVACGAFHSLLQTHSGRLYSSGLNSHGQLGLGDQEARIEFHLLPFFAVAQNCDYHANEPESKLGLPSVGTSSASAFAFSGLQQRSSAQVGAQAKQRPVHCHRVCTAISAGESHSAAIVKCKRLLDNDQTLPTDLPNAETDAVPAPAAAAADQLRHVYAWGKGIAPESKGAHKDAPNQQAAKSTVQAAAPIATQTIQTPAKSAKASAKALAAEGFGADSTTTSALFACEPRVVPHLSGQFEDWMQSAGDATSIRNLLPSTGALAIQAFRSSARTS